MLLFRPDLEDDQLQSAVERVTRAIVNAGGSLSKISPWGKRRLAYPIQRHRDASYFLIHFDIDPAAVREIERGLVISEEILRHLVVVLEPRKKGVAEAEEDTSPIDVETAVAAVLAPPAAVDAPPPEELEPGVADVGDAEDIQVDASEEVAS
jgi:small subunit ribosomal protein S6